MPINPNWIFRQFTIYQKNRIILVLRFRLGSPVGLKLIDSLELIVKSVLVDVERFKALMNIREFAADPIAALQKHLFT